jgi:citrate synthase
LTVIDNRNGNQYEIPISVTDNDAFIPAASFKDITHTLPKQSNSKSKSVEKGGKPEKVEKVGLRVIDRGFLNTAVIQSKITFIDGDKGILRYRGYPIEQLAEHSNFLETAYLLIWGELPTKSKYELFHTEVMNHSTMHVDVEDILSAFRYGEFRFISFI